MTKDQVNGQDQSPVSRRGECNGRSLTVRLSTVQSPTVTLSAYTWAVSAGVVTPDGADSTIVSKSILSLQTSVLVLQNV